MFAPLVFFFGYIFNTVWVYAQTEAAIMLPVVTGRKGAFLADDFTGEPMSPDATDLAVDVKGPIGFLVTASL